MKSDEIHSRAITLTNACFKVSALIKTGLPIANYSRGELVRYASELAIQSKGLTTGQVSALFVERLNRCVDAANGCGFWLEQVLKDKLMDNSIISPLISECDQLSQLFLSALNSAKSKID